MRDLTLLTDFYQLTMSAGYLHTGMSNKRATFDLFYRENPFGGGYTVTAGLEQVIEYIQNLRFDKEDIEYLRGLNAFPKEFLDSLPSFRFAGDVYAMPEGTVAFPREPIIRVTAPIAQAQIIETAILNIVNHQTLIATKAARVCQAACGKPVMEFGLRRAQGPDGGVYGARAAVIGGCVGTSNVLAAKMFGVPPKGTIAHSWVMSFSDEAESFRAYAKLFPNAITLLVDTYNTLKSGVPNAIKIFSELRAGGANELSFAIRLDSGDMAYLSKRARAMLDEAGFPNVKICGSSDFDEYLIESLNAQGARLDLYGVGTRLITAHDCPSLGGVYKLAAIGGADLELTPKIKVSENPQKITNPGIKQVYRVFDLADGSARADIIALLSETYNEIADLTIFDPDATWKKTVFSGGTYRLRPLLQPVFAGGELVYKSPSVMDIRRNAANELATMWDEVKRLANPHRYHVDLSSNLFALKTEMLNAASLLGTVNQ